jgi:hypothetical protein
MCSLRWSIASDCVRMVFVCVCADAADILSGHCETVAATLAARVVARLRVTSATTALTDTYTSLCSELEPVTFSEQMAVLFASERTARAFESPPRRRPWVMWPQLQAAGAHSSTEYCMGLPDADRRLHAVAVQCAAAAVSVSTPSVPAGPDVDAVAGSDGPIATVPLYVLNYIWDGDELEDADMGSTEHETAQYVVSFSV